MFDYPVPYDEHDATPPDLMSAEGGLGDILSGVGNFLVDVATIATGGSDPGTGPVINQPPPNAGTGNSTLDQLINALVGSFAPQETTVSLCPPPLVRDSNGQCVFSGSPGDMSVNGQAGAGQVVAGRYGAAEIPVVSSRTTRRCRKGQVLGDDNLCYRRRDLRKDERKWDPGRRPMFTGGDLNAIARAHRLEKTAAKVARQLGYSVKTKAAAAREAGKRAGARARARGRGAPRDITVIDTD